MTLLRPSSLTLAFLLAATAHAADWSVATAPGAWEEKGPPAARSLDGAVWYRTWVRPAPLFFTSHERNLFEESVTINLSDVADAHEAFVNGVRVGSGGRFPPAFESGRTDRYAHKVPVGTLKKDQWNEIAIRIYNRTGPGGFLGEAPSIMTYNLECMLEGAWEFLPDDGYTPGGALAEKPARSSFSEFRSSSRVLTRTKQLVTGPKLGPAESLAKLKPADDLAIDLILVEPLIAQGTHLSFDERGRTWVTQYRQYPYPAGIKMVSRDAYYRAVYDRVPPPPPNHDRGADLISIHEDTDGDGKFDRHKVFQDGLNMANSALRGRGGVWVMNPPYLLFYPDADFDDVPDGPPVVHLQGFGLEDTHSVSNGLVWGPDGWLYGCHGSTSSSRVTRPGLEPANAPGVYFEGCMVWRYHPETRAYELFSEGSGNPFGLELDAEGRLYSGLNSGTSRGFHYVQGGFFLMQGVTPAKFGPARNPYSFGELPKMATLTPVARFSHYGAFVDGTALPAKYHGHLFALDPLHNEIIDVERRPLGATFETKDLGVVAKSSDVAFRPIYSANAPDGSMYVSDMYEYYIAHGQHYQNQIDPSTGRLYRLRGRDLPLERDTNLFAKSSADLVPFLAHANKWHRLTAVRLLGERRAVNVAPQLRALLARDRGLGALAAVWALHQLDALDEATTLAALRHEHSSVRTWAVRLFGERHGENRGLGLAAAKATPPPAASAALLSALEKLARDEPNAEVRGQLLSTARRLPTTDALRLAAAFCSPRPALPDGPAASGDADASDTYIPLLTWWILEAHVRLNRAAVLEWFTRPELWQRPLVQQHLLPRIMKRFAMEGRREDLLVCARLLRLAPSPVHAAALMKGFEEAYRGRETVGLPDELMQALADTGQTPLVLRVRQGDQTAIRDALTLLQNAKAPAAERVFYARVFGEVPVPASVPVLRTLAAGTANPAPLRSAALVALMIYDVPDTGAWAAGLVPKLNGTVRTAAFALLASRAEWSVALLRAVEAGSVPVGDVPPDMVARMRAHRDERVAGLIGKLFPAAPPAAAAPDWNRRIAEIEAVLRGGPGNPYAGEAAFTARCASCHKLFFKGGKVGPDLTYYQRDNLGTMLISIVNPNAEIREGFEYTLLETKDGRSLSGFLVERDSQVVVLRGLEGEDIALRQSDVKELRPVGRSLMPEGLLEGLSDRELRDFFAYLRISQPITR
ncbi:PVC-type heme-binding CxxCH protein [Horticoccus sp. 23ND18S-11]|uniref:PVC-type heme-binding CxxCH protein n=1 Tax=Horticoccus sp. 23ND18S-11 TaxID=3391832 RepID=UPI0039C9A727